MILAIRAFLSSGRYRNWLSGISLRKQVPSVDRNTCSLSAHRPFVDIPQDFWCKWKSYRPVNLWGLCGLSKMEPISLKNSNCLPSLLKSLLWGFSYSGAKHLLPFQTWKWFQRALCAPVPQHALTWQGLAIFSNPGWPLRQLLWL